MDDKSLHRQKYIILFFVVCSSLLLMKAAHIQIIDSSYRDQAERTTLAKNTNYPARGMMFDRNNELIVANNPIYDLEVIYNNIDENMDVPLFCQLLNISEEEYNSKFPNRWGGRFSKAKPFIFINKISPSQYASFQEHLHLFPGFYPVMRNIRFYPHESGAHMLGYLSEVNTQDIEQADGTYAPGDIHGVSGLEKVYEDILRGKKGVSYMLKDNLGRDVEQYNGGALDSTAVSGEDIQLSIDLDLQRYAEKLLQNKRGAIVALEPSTGEILTMVSAPNYNPNDLTFSRNRDSIFRVLQGDTLNRPMINRSVTAKYPPGSVFKPILSLIALEKEVLRANRYINCNGVYAPTGQKCHDHVSARNVSQALQHSCNVYYYQLLNEFLRDDNFDNYPEAMDTLMEALKRFGLGDKLGVDYTFENEGYLPYGSHFNEVHKKEINGWKPEWVLSLGIGQGEFEFTTLQMANLAAAIANRGYYIKPHFIKKHLTSGKPIQEKYRLRNTTGISENHFTPVIDGMELAVLRGTSTSAAVADISVCGKTGTSQNPHGEDHSVFVAFAPKENPKIAIAVYVENGGWGATYAAPIAGLVIEKYLKREISPQKKWMEEKMISSSLLNTLQ